MAPAQTSASSTCFRVRHLKTRQLLFQPTHTKRLADCSDDSDKGIVAKVGNSLEDSKQRLAGCTSSGILDVVQNIADGISLLNRACTCRLGKEQADRDKRQELHVCLLPWKSFISSMLTLAFISCKYSVAAPTLISDKLQVYDEFLSMRVRVDRQSIVSRARAMAATCYSTTGKTIFALLHVCSIQSLT